MPTVLEETRTPTGTQPPVRTRTPAGTPAGQGHRWLSGPREGGIAHPEGGTEATKVRSHFLQGLGSGTRAREGKRGPDLDQIPQQSKRDKGWERVNALPPQLQPIDAPVPWGM